MNSIDVALICKALGDSNRLQIIEILSKCNEKCACNLLEHFQITQPTLSHHMKVLNECGLVDTRRDGKWNHYSINMETLKEFEKYIKNLCCDEIGEIQ
ncbi:ArsR family transcriptional regulator [Peptoniphilus sp. ING2-D1G]|nr:ArsR family transcriptional regulator [Peptoniphilus sp. ING2-D1G]